MNAIIDFVKRDTRTTFFTLTLSITLLFFAPWNYTHRSGTSAADLVQRDDPPGKTKPLHANGAALDVHTHIASQALADLMTGGGVLAPGADDLVAKLDEAHVKRAVILSGAYFALPDDSNVIPENDYIAAEVGKFPDRLIGFCGINPLFDSALAEIDRCLGLPGMVGIKLHLEGSQVDLTDENHVEKLNAVFDRIAALDAPVTMHISEPNELPLSGQSFANLAAILDAHPTVRVAFAHCAGHADDDAIELWLRLHNSGYYPETSFVDVSACLAFHVDAPLAQRELMVWRFRKWGIDHVLFGSDYFAFFGETPQETLDILIKYPFTQQELDTILNNDGSAWLGQ
ncbi:MAG TPA: amidohydrolase family protein [Caldilineaceae bacterium]|nr:amidohydrolase family protein [Caldilineaceae bacterium]